MFNFVQGNDTFRERQVSFDERRSRRPGLRLVNPTLIQCPRGVLREIAVNQMYRQAAGEGPPRQLKVLCLVVEHGLSEAATIVVSSANEQNVTARFGASIRAALGRVQVEPMIAEVHLKVEWRAGRRSRVWLRVKPNQPVRQFA